jgi:hypothetical protein
MLLHHIVSRIVSKGSKNITKERTYAYRHLRLGSLCVSFSVHDSHVLDWLQSMIRVSIGNRGFGFGASSGDDAHKGVILS